MDVGVPDQFLNIRSHNREDESFATHGLPEHLVTDGWPSFTSEKFQQFMNNNDIRHILTSPHHPSSNGQAEQAVQTLLSQE